MNGVIDKHTKDNLDFLLIGAKPLISSAKPIKRELEEPEEITEEDFKGFPEPTVSIKRTRPKTAQSLKDPLPKSRTMDTPSYNRLKKDLNSQRNVQDFLMVHEANQKRKSDQMHQDWEEQYMEKFDNRMKKQLSGRNYKTFRRSQSRAYTSLSARTMTEMLYHDEPEQVPFVRVSTSGLGDRVHVASLNAKKERELTRTISSLSARKPVDDEPEMAMTSRPELNKISRLYETKFAGAEEKIPPKGKKYFKQQNSSRITQTISNLSNY
ncbi:hypothetical protein TVAG_480740 [Trichomonas vaginalis G3]|uniref:Uncharacterized protein n=1 Tax=Trichomonas vaginalis (strain ATCC PRA-98 / G3) TaxID=412133 RepID=A2FLH4_TRIV3|nr:hypothetical protein TVAGG3_0907780 [Trichomonas vaginalis G3]EAX94257.1 hypothetical protein TVAG_480740 [Trichomonas vaginalis G3]KAI5484191.1 hypothetical protein TVAGG3_0907780 [Trichomonas vaginalis G3]|eukprot:XP_001307187.1 hypothetical protein [Trichomonas vaginalis G3]